MNRMKLGEILSVSMVGLLRRVFAEDGEQSYFDSGKLF